MFSLFNPWSLSLVFQVLMLIHFFRNRPEGYWFFVILFFGPIGSLIYFFVEVVPGLNWKLPAIQRFERQRRAKWLEKVVEESPSQEALSELAEIYGGEGLHPGAIELFGRAIRLDPEDPAGYYGRGRSYLETGAYSEAVADLERVVAIDPSFRFHGGYLALAQAYEALGDDTKAKAAYEAILNRTTLSAAYYGYARLLAAQGDTDKARRMLEEILAKQNGLPRYLRRQERPWVRRAKGLLKTLEIGTRRSI